MILYKPIHRELPEDLKISVGVNLSEHVQTLSHGSDDVQRESSLEYHRPMQ